MRSPAWQEPSSPWRNISATSQRGTCTARDTMSAGLVRVDLENDHNLDPYIALLGAKALPAKSPNSRHRKAQAGTSSVLQPPHANGAAEVGGRVERVAVGAEADRRGAADQLEALGDAAGLHVPAENVFVLRPAAGWAGE